MGSSIARVVGNLLVVSTRRVYMGAGASERAWFEVFDHIVAGVAHRASRVV